MRVISAVSSLWRQEHLVSKTKIDQFINWWGLAKIDFIAYEGNSFTLNANVLL